MDLRQYDVRMKNDHEKPRNLPVGEKPQIIEQLGSDILDGDETLVISEAIIQEARRREAEFIANPDSALTHEELWKRVEHREN